MQTPIDLDAAAKAGIIGEDQVTALLNFQAKQDGFSSATSEKFVLFGGYTDLVAALGTGMVAFGILFLAFVSMEQGPPSYEGNFLCFVIFSMLSVLIIKVARKINLRSFPALTTVLLFGVFGYIGFTLQNILVGSAFLSGFLDMNHGRKYALVSYAAYMLGAIFTYRIFWSIVRFPPIPALFTVFLAFAISAIGNIYVDPWQSTWERNFDVCARILLGICTLAHAIWWDLSDVRRETERSQIAFWLHCVAGFLIIGSIGLLLGTEHIDPNGPRRMAYSASDFIIVFAMISAAATVSLLLDRRSFLTGAILPLCWMLSPGGVPLGVPMSGALLLFFTIYWVQMRSKLLEKLPKKIAAQLPRTELIATGRRPTRQHLPYLPRKW